MITETVCSQHNLPQDSVCLAETCRERLRCQICVKKHEHKFYLDDKERDKKISTILTEILEKCEYVRTYKKSNIANLKLTEYREQTMQKLADLEIFLQSKIFEETLNFKLQIDTVQRKIKNLIDECRESILKGWQAVYKESMIHSNCDDEVDQMKESFKNIKIAQLQDVEKCVKFLYSDQLVFRFNKQFDSLKIKIHHQKKQNVIAVGWLENQQHLSMSIHPCQPEIFRQWMELYDGMPMRQTYEQERTRETRDQKIAKTESDEMTGQRQLLQIKIKYENFQHIFRIARFDNQKFISSGGRSINTWNRISLSPDRVYPLEFPSYGLLRFKLHDSSARIIFGLSNGQLCQIHPVNDDVCRMPAHENTIRQIIQYDSNHLITASQDWTMKVWAISQNLHEQKFVRYRDTLKGHSGKIYTLCKFGPNVLSGGIDGTIKLWDIIRSEYDEVFPQQKQIYALRQLRPQLFVSAGQIKQLSFWDYRKTKAPVFKHALQNSSNCLLKFDENTLVFNDRNVIKILDLRNTKEPVIAFCEDNIYSHTVNHMEFLSDNEVGMGGSDNFITVWKY